METLPTAQATNSTGPTGGVMVPMPRLTISTMPNCTGSMPSALTTGRKIGVPIMISGAMSMNVPSTSRVTLISSSRAEASPQAGVSFSTKRPNTAQATITVITTSAVPATSTAPGASTAMVAE